MSEPQFEPVQLPRPGPPDLGISFLKPKDWHLVTLPDEPDKFDQPGYFKPLAIAMASFGAVLFTVAARPKFDDGSVQQWTQFLCNENNIEIVSGSNTTLGGLEGCLVIGKQDSDAGVMKMRVFFFEDGGRLFQTNIVAPEQIWPSLEQQLDFMQRSFRLDVKLGQTAPIAPPPLQPVEEKPPAPPVETVAEAPANEEPTVISAVALASDAETLRNDHPMNAKMRNNGVGLVPRVLEINDNEKYAVLGAAAVSATFKVPLGWHVMDDGKRTLIYDAGGKMQINLSRRPLEGKSVDDLIDGIIAEYTADQPEVLHLKLNVFGLTCVAFRNFKVEGEVLEQVFMFRESTQHPGTAQCCRTTADSANITFATNAAEVVMRDLDETGQSVKKLDWRETVHMLEKLGELEAAEQVLRKSIDHIGLYSSLAYLWEKEVGRLAAKGDTAGAKAAAKKAEDFLYTYAGCATSGGEGAALSLERDERLKGLTAWLD